jgi:hypothetical protein
VSGTVGECQGSRSSAAKVIRESFDQMPPGVANQIEQEFKSLHAKRAEGGRATYKVGSICSGTDIAYLIVVLFFSLVVSGKFGLDFALVHAFACDNDPTAQQFLRAFHNPGFIFADAEALCLGPTAFDILSGASQVVPLVDLLIAGFSCKDFSRLNGKRRHNGSIIANHTGTSGKTAWAVILFLTVFRPMLAILENVAGMDREVEGQSCNNFQAFRKADCSLKTKDF